MFLYIGLLIIILLILFIYKYRDISASFSAVLMRIHCGENEIDELLNKKATLLDDICEEINNINDNKIFSLVKKDSKKNIDSIKLDRDLSVLYLELKEYLLVNKSFIPEEELKNKIEKLSELEIDLEATKSYYNDNSMIFNDLLAKFPSKIIGKKKSYDSKNLYSFSKEEFFEILKKDKIKKDA
jgi:hypothetical protein